MKKNQALAMVLFLIFQGFLPISQDAYIHVCVYVCVYACVCLCVNAHVSTWRQAFYISQDGPKLADLGLGLQMLYLIRQVKFLRRILTFFTAFLHY